MSSSQRVAKAASWVSLWCVGVALAGCPQPFVERIPTVVAPVAPGCNEEEPGTVTPVARAPTSVASSRLWAHAGCQASTVSTLARHVAVMQPDGGMFFLDLISEQRIDSSREVDSTGSFCRVVVQTRVWREKEVGVRLEVSPITADVTLCDARLTSPDASALVAAGARAILERVDVGAAAPDGPVELAALFTEPRDMPITASPSSTSCGDGDDVTERIDRYAHAERLVVRFPLKDAPRFAWSSAIELDFEVRAVSGR